MDDLDVRTIISWQIGKLIDRIEEPEKLIPVIAAALHIWCNEHGEDMEFVTALFMETVSSATGLDIEKGGAE